MLAFWGVNKGSYNQTSTITLSSPLLKRSQQRSPFARRDWLAPQPWNCNDFRPSYRPPSYATKAGGWATQLNKLYNQHGFIFHKLGVNIIKYVKSPRSTCSMLNFCLAILTDGDPTKEIPKKCFQLLFGYDLQPLNTNMVGWKITMFNGRSIFKCLFLNGHVSCRGRWNTFLKVWHYTCWLGGEKKQIHPGILTWNLQITHLERKIILQTSRIMFQPLIFRGVAKKILYL